MQTILSFVQNSWLALLLTAVVAYLFGSLNSAIIVTKALAKDDIRNFGSGNAGATNVLRSQGKLPAILTTAGDLLKSFCAVLIGGWLLKTIGATDVITPQMYGLIGAYLAGVFCILGHLYPLYFGFKGGKGVLTSLGMMLILDWKVALICLGIFIVVVCFSRMVSLGSVIAAVSLPVMTFIFRTYIYHQPATVVAFCTAMAVLIGLILICKHIPNIKRILNGTENKLSFKSKHSS